MENNNGPISTDLLIIGSGPGGHEAALRASQLGLDVTLAEMNKYGGVCVHSGCMPSKALIGATNLAYSMSHAENMGITSSHSIDFTQLNSWKNGIVSQLERQIEKMCLAKKINLLHGAITFLTTTSARLTPPSPHPLRDISFKHAIIATGSRPTELSGFEFDSNNIISSKTALSLKSIPEKLVIVGAGYIGMELSALFAKLGSHVDVIELQHKILPNYEDDISKLVQKHSEHIGINFHFGESVSSWSKSKSRITITTTTPTGDTHDYSCDKAIVAVGRTPVTETLDLDAISLKPDSHGFIPVDNQCRTSISNIFAIGDVAGPPMLAHKASMEGKIAAEAISNKNVISNNTSVPSVVFTTPEIGTVGLTKLQAEEEGLDVSIGKVPYSALGRAHLTNEPIGFVRIVSEASTGSVIGGQIVGPSASELIAEIGLAIQSKTTTSDLANTIHAHPTFSELIATAARIASNR
ncbi:MAG TPA: dihydrolipoyl dehydrogenase [Halobacteriales archaeon]|uniref:dihydrolipoyl dehydrogenase n=1 Tax=Candidatus Hikarchaeum yamanae TaxID=2675326 RepID=UPI0017C8BA6D|nr:dihydrolipoyl dehydrogenase [Halobacteriales archaeon]|tara:strand:+ start:28928 stop:30328 length:1401 start_codon:yes stop_codon:yes gene_type:complete